MQKEAQTTIIGQEGILSSLKKCFLGSNLVEKWTKEHLSVKFKTFPSKNTPGIFAKVMSGGEKKILSRVIGIQKEKCG